MTVLSPSFALTGALIVWLSSWALLARASRQPLARAAALRNADEWRRRVLVQRTVAVLYIPAGFLAVCAAVAPLIAPAFVDHVVEAHVMRWPYDEDDLQKRRVALQRDFALALRRPDGTPERFERIVMEDLGGYGGAGDLLSGVAVDVFRTSRLRGLLAYAVFARLTLFATLAAALVAFRWFKRAAGRVPLRDGDDRGGIAHGVSAPATPTAAFRAQR